MYLSPAGTDLNPRQSLERRWPTTSWTSASRLLRPRLRWTATPRALACPPPPCFPRFQVAVDSAFHSQAPDPKRGPSAACGKAQPTLHFLPIWRKCHKSGWWSGGEPSHCKYDLEGARRGARGPGRRGHPAGDSRSRSAP